MSDVKNDRIDRIVQAVRKLKAEVGERKVAAQLWEIEKELLQLDMDLVVKELGTNR